MKPKRILKKLRDETGQGLVEFALILPIFLLLVLGMLDYGWLLNAEISVNFAAKEAARIMVVSDGKSMTDKKKNVESMVGIPAVDIAAPVTVPASGSALKVEVKKTVTPLVGLYVSGTKVLTGSATMRME